MTAAIPLPPRLLAALGVVLLAALALVIARPLLLGEDDSASSPTPPLATPTPAVVTPVVTPAAKPVVPKVELLPGLPLKVAAKLRQSRVVVVSVYSGTSVLDRAAVSEAKAGARAAGANFTKINILDERSARQLHAFAGTALSTPAVLVVRRPGKIVGRFDAVVDSALIAQAAHNAGARGGK